MKKFTIALVALLVAGSAFAISPKIKKYVAAVAAQVDTNDTTVVTSYKPAFAGQILIGKAGVGTNRIWVAKGTTTNDWVKISD